MLSNHALRQGLLVLCAVCAFPVAAENSILLDPLIISATRDERPFAKTAASISVITSEDIQNSGASHISELLRGQGAVQITDIGGNGSRATVSIRGFGDNAAANSLILFDGRALNNSDLAAADINSINLQDVERIEIIQGSAGVLYGDQAVGGVINIITRRNAAAGQSARVWAKLGTDQYQQLNLLYSQRFQSGIGMRLSADKKNTDNYRDNNQLHSLNLSAAIDYQHERGEFSLKYQYYDEDLGLPGSLFSEQLQIDRKQTRFPNDFNEQLTRIWQIGLVQDLSENWVFSADLSQRDSSGIGKLTDIGFTQDRNISRFTPRFHLDYPVQEGDVLLTFGADLERLDYEFNAFGPQKSDREQTAYYAQVVIPLSQQLNLTTGARHARMSDALSDSFSFPQGVVFKNKATVFSAAVDYALTQQLGLFLRADQNYRFPKLDELTFTASADRGLKTQTGISWEMGTNWRSDKAQFKLTLYQLRLKNEIAFDPSAGFFGANSNLDKSRRNGLIIDSRWLLNNALTLSGQYSFTDAKIRTGDFSGNRIPQVAAHNFRIAMNYQVNHKWLLNAELLAISQRIASGDFANQLQTLSGYGIVNLGAQYHLGNWKFSLRINNVLNKQYSDAAGQQYNPFPNLQTGYFPAAEINLIAGLGYQF